MIIYESDGSELCDTSEVYDGGYLPMAQDGRREFYLAEDSDSAGEAARKYWQEMAESDPKEFTCMVGEETLVQWGLGRSAGPGSSHVNSLEEWLDLWLNTPEEQWASYDGSEIDLMSEDAASNLPRFHEPNEDGEGPDNWEEYRDEVIGEVGFWPTVAYRHN